MYLKCFNYHFSLTDSNKSRVQNSDSSLKPDPCCFQATTPKIIKLPRAQRMQVQRSQPHAHLLHVFSGPHVVGSENMVCTTVYTGHITHI